MLHFWQAQKEVSCLEEATVKCDIIDGSVSVLLLTLPEEDPRGAIMCPQTPYSSCFLTVESRIALAKAFAAQLSLLKSKIQIIGHCFSQLRLFNLFSVCPGEPFPLQNVCTKSLTSNTDFRFWLFVLYSHIFHIVMIETRFFRNARQKGLRDKSERLYRQIISVRKSQKNNLFNK